jgi:hypothetical protein
MATTVLILYYDMENGVYYSKEEFERLFVGVLTDMEIAMRFMPFARKMLDTPTEV